MKIMEQLLNATTPWSRAKYVAQEEKIWQHKSFRHIRDWIDCHLFLLGVRKATRNYTEEQYLEYGLRAELYLFYGAYEELCEKHEWNFKYIIGRLDDTSEENMRLMSNNFHNHKWMG